MTADAETRRIYGEGCLASHQGKPRSDCPYPEGSVDRAAWRTGWDEASEDDLREGGTCEELCSAKNPLRAWLDQEVIVMEPTQHGPGAHHKAPAETKAGVLLGGQRRRRRWIRDTRP